MAETKVAAGAAEPERSGATYLIKDGVRTVLEDATVDHPDGNQARPADDAPDGAPASAAAAPPAPPSFLRKVTALVTTDPKNQKGGEA